MVKFDELSDDTVERLKACGVEEKDLFTHESDLYVGCKTYEQSNVLKKEFKHMATKFFPEAGSEMDHYPVAVDIAFGYMDAHFKKKYGNRPK